MVCFGDVLVVCVRMIAGFGSLGQDHLLHDELHVLKLALEAVTKIFKR